jgi:hypothetical protein
MEVGKVDSSLPECSDSSTSTGFKAFWLSANLLMKGPLTICDISVINELLPIDDFNFF